MTPEELIKKFPKSWDGIAKAFAESDMRWQQEHWEEFIRLIEERTREESRVMLMEVLEEVERGVDHGESTVQLDAVEELFTERIDNLIKETK